MKRNGDKSNQGLKRKNFKSSQLIIIIDIIITGGNKRNPKLAYHNIDKNHVIKLMINRKENL